MKKFVIEKDFFEIFPDAHIGVLICRGIDNRVRDPEKYARYLEESSSEALKYIPVSYTHLDVYKRQI